MGILMANNYIYSIPNENEKCTHTMNACTLSTEWAWCESRQALVLGGVEIETTYAQNILKTRRRWPREWANGIDARTRWGAKKRVYISLINRTPNRDWKINEPTGERDRAATECLAPQLFLLVLSAMAKCVELTLARGGTSVHIYIICCGDIYTI